MEGIIFSPASLLEIPPITHPSTQGGNVGLSSVDPTLPSPTRAAQSLSSVNSTPKYLSNLSILLFLTLPALWSRQLAPLTWGIPTPLSRPPCPHLCPSLWIFYFFLNIQKVYSLAGLEFLGPKQ